MPFDQLADPRRYEQELEKLRERFIQRGRPEALSQGELSLKTVGLADGGVFARILAHTVASGSYAFGPSEEHRSWIDGKWRTLYRARLTDTIVLGVLAQVISESVEQNLSPRLYSYRIGRSPWRAIADFLFFLSQHRLQFPDRKQRRLYVIRRDVRSYGESIPIADGSRLWKIMRDALGGPTEGRWWRLVEGALWPEVCRPDGTIVRLNRGVPTGSPMQPVICNLYLAPVDRAAEAITGGFYARFGDDILFAHPDAAVAQRTARAIDETIASLGLEIKQSKRQELYFTAPGRPSTDWPESRPVSYVEYLGCRVGFLGAVGLKAEKARRLMVDIRRRMRNTHRLLENASPDERARVLCAVVNRALDPYSPVADRVAPLLRFIVDDRRQLKQLDFFIALELAQILSGRRGVRAFRRVRYRALRADFGLVSLVAARNARRRHRKRMVGP